MPLSDVGIRGAKPQGKPYKLFDGGGLFLLVTPPGGKWWRLKYRFEGKEKSLSFGVYPDVGLKEARRRRDSAREMLAQGIDPGEQRKEAKAVANAIQKEHRNTFEVVALEWYASYSPSLTPKHADKLQRYLTTILFPALGTALITELEPGDILNVIRPTESKGHITTAHKLMQLCGQVMKYAHLTGRMRHNPAAGLSGALQPLRHENHAAVIEPDAIGKLLRDIDAHVGFPSITFFLRILPSLPGPQS